MENFERGAMKRGENTAKSMSQHGFTQFELTKKVLNNLSQFKLKPTTINVLLYLTSCYNPKNNYVFPKQKTIASVFNCSERSVIRAIQELVKEGLIIVECNCTNRYKFTSKIIGECPQNDKNFCKNKMSDTNDKISSQSDNLSPACIEQTIEQEKEQLLKRLGGNVYSNEMQPTNLEEYQILKDYAEKHNAKNVNAYIAKLKQTGSDKTILKEHHKKAFISCRAQQNIIKTQQYCAEQRRLSTTAVLPFECEAWKNCLKTKKVRRYSV